MSAQSCCIASQKLGDFAICSNLPEEKELFHVATWNLNMLGVKEDITCSSFCTYILEMDKCITRISHVVDRKEKLVMCFLPKALEAAT